MVSIFITMSEKAGMPEDITPKKATPFLLAAVGCCALPLVAISGGGIVFASVLAVSAVGGTIYKFQQRKQQEEESEKKPNTMP